MVPEKIYRGNSGAQLFQPEETALLTEIRKTPTLNWNTSLKQSNTFMHAIKYLYQIRDKKLQHDNKARSEVKDYLKAKGWKTGRAALASLAPRMERPGLRPGAGKSRTRYALL